MIDPDNGPTERRRKGLIERHPRLGIVLIGAIFLIPICVMCAVVAILIAA